MPDIIKAGRNPMAGKLLQCDECKQIIRLKEDDPIPRKVPHRGRMGTYAYEYPCSFCDDYATPHVITNHGSDDGYPPGESQQEYFGR